MNGQSPGCFAGMFSAWRWLTGLFTMPVAARNRAGTCSTSSAASAANGGNQREGVPFAALPAEVTAAIAQCLSSYADLCAFRRIDKSRHTALSHTVLLPILIRLLPIVAASLGLGVLVEVPVPQLTQGVAVTVALTRALIEQLSRRLFMLERGGSWARWKPVVEMLYLLRGKRPLVLRDDNFGVFGSRAAFMSETEAVRQWKILSWGATVNQGGQQRPLMDGDSILNQWPGYQLPSLLDSASPLFPHAPFDPADPHTQLDGGTYPNYTSMVAFIVFDRLDEGNHINRIRHWSSYCRASAAYFRAGDRLTASHSDAAQWGAAVFDQKWEDGWHRRLVVLGSEAMGEGHMAVIRLTRTNGRRVEIFTTESAPHDHTRTVVMRVLGDHLGGMVWRQEDET
ncbi:unnamed protein product [Vitrella brassicaformis CCMP3155]|uniref:F-box domain-containing protein n=1 Tax=Vitrella brassicaformis (strain CCMP3155) TaxID=1169540 RepID=A0A0G4EX20_VITBC|nr:unnamed protein product [Vitrella brassicaformis CCMP3155]|eukprot:CEM03542.1 unnamed protein product [Vitrella brassicaformis CCMP3155]